jgi:hypothetical protein
MNSFFLFKLFVFVLVSCFIFLCGYLAANYHHLLHHGLKCPPTEVQQLQSRSASLRKNSVACRKRPRVSAKTTKIKKQLSAYINPSYTTKTSEGVAQPRALTDVFSMFHHPGSPLTSEIVLYPGRLLNSSDIHAFRSDKRDFYDGCSKIYLTRTGSLANMPNKCLAIPFVSPFDVDPIPHYHRVGKISGMINMYQADFIKGGSLKTEKSLLPLMLQDLSSIIKQFIAVVGSPISSEGGKRRSLIIMVLNEGVVDLFLNFLCSCRSSGILSQIIDSLVVITGQEHLVTLIGSMGVKAFFHSSLGPIPKKAADFYGDRTFGMLMWFKITSVYLALKAGFNVLFQDVDLVWMENPLPILERMNSNDIIFMDDGAR